MNNEEWDSRSKEIWDALGEIAPYEPDPSLRSQFYERFWRSLQPFRRTTFWPAAVAAGLAILAIGFLAGYSMKGSGGSQMAQLQGEVSNLRQMVALSLLRQQDASDRLKGVNWAYQIREPEPEVLSALLYTMNHDPNVNVRLAAVDALRVFFGSSAVRQGLIQALNQQNSPLVQVALIDQLADKRERSAEPALRQLTHNAQINPDVRQRAEWALGRIQ